MTGKYLFGDTDLAARRLAVLAEVFAESSRAFLLDDCDTKPNVALDLGCGPGFTTHLVSDAVKCDTVGLDNSEHFMSLAEKTGTERVSFRLHDITSVPFPVGSSDLIYSRFVLTHLKEPETVIGRWAAQLTPNGLLLLEEVESIRTSNSLFGTYLGIVDGMLAHQGNQLYIGPKLDRLEPAGLSKRATRVARLTVPNHLAATMFSMNMATWKHAPFIRETYSQESIAQVQRDMEAIAAKPGRDAEIEWGLRQIVLERVTS